MRESEKHLDSVALEALEEKVGKSTVDRVPDPYLPLAIEYAIKDGNAETGIALSYYAAFQNIKDKEDVAEEFGVSSSTIYHMMRKKDSLKSAEPLNPHQAYKLLRDGDSAAEYFELMFEDIREQTTQTSLEDISLEEDQIYAFRQEKSENTKWIDIGYPEDQAIRLTDENLALRFIPQDSVLTGSSHMISCSPASINQNFTQGVAELSEEYQEMVDYLVQDSTIQNPF